MINDVQICKNAALEKPTKPVNANKQFLVIEKLPTMSNWVSYKPDDEF